LLCSSCQRIRAEGASQDLTEGRGGNTTSPRFNLSVIILLEIHRVAPNKDSLNFIISIPTNGKSTMSYLFAVEQNNLGVIYLEAGDLRTALERFSDALKFTMGELDPPQTPHTPRGSPPLRFTGNALSPVKVMESHVATNSSTGPKPVSDLNDTGALPCSAPFAYARGINLIPCETAYSSDVLINTTIVSSLIIFNLSIIYHLKGLEQGRSQSIIRLLKAKSLYAKSHQLLTDAGVPLGSTGNPVIDMLSMALFNNLAHVCFELASYDESRQYFDHLIRVALTVIPSRYGDAHIGSLLDLQKSNFLLNAIILQTPKLAAAA
jgi:tetratricopeptide (TPR) repeat protein